MLNNFEKYLKTIYILIIILIIFIVPFLKTNNVEGNNPIQVQSEYGFIWPVENHISISSYFGKRNAPTEFASTYHSGIDIPAPENTKVFAIDDAKVIFAGWGAGGGYTITLQLKNYPELKISYCHLSPIMFVNKDEEITKGKIVGTVGPRNVYGINDNPYSDENGNPTNGVTTGCHLHFTIKQNGEPVDPLQYYNYK